MLHILSEITNTWGTPRLLQPDFFLIVLGVIITSLTVLVTLPHMASYLPVVGKDKKHASGLVIITIWTLSCLLIIPPLTSQYEVLGCIYLTMIKGHLSDSRYFKRGCCCVIFVDILLVILTATAFCQLESVNMWLPFSGQIFKCPAWAFVTISAPLLLVLMHSTSRLGRIDALCGSLAITSLSFIGLFLYVVIGHPFCSEYLLVPHNPVGGHWAMMMLVLAGSISGFLWFSIGAFGMSMGRAGTQAIGLALGVGVMATGNLFFAIVITPISLINFIVKFSIRHENVKHSNTKYNLLEYCLERGWSPSQIIIRLMIIQACVLLTTFMALLKIR